MARLVQRFRHWLADDQVTYECRHRDTTLDKQQDTCPACGGDEIVAFDLE